MPEHTQTITHCDQVGFITGMKENLTFKSKAPH